MKKTVKALLQIFFLLFPWKIRRILLNFILGFKIHRKAKVSCSLILADRLEMGPYSRIFSFTICNNIDLLKLNDYATLGTFIYITGYPSKLKEHFSHVENRSCRLEVGKHSAITSRHFLDCTAGISIGCYTTVAGIRSQILTHSIDLKNNRQNAIPIEIGDFCFVGTNCVFLPGSKLPDYSILGAKSLLNKSYLETDCLFGGVPAVKVKELKRDEIGYFNRDFGSVK